MDDYRRFAIISFILSLFLGTCSIWAIFFTPPEWVLQTAKIFGPCTIPFLWFALAVFYQRTKDKKPNKST